MNTVATLLESEYAFGERIYDATQKASDYGNVTVIYAIWDRREIKSYPCEGLASAYHFIEISNSNYEKYDKVTVYIIGGDILDD